MMFNRLFKIISSPTALLAVTLITLTSCATSPKKEVSKHHAFTKDGFPSDSVREAYLRLKKNSAFQSRFKTKKNFPF